MTTAADVLTANGFSNVDDLIRAASVEGLPLYVAAAFVDMESNGENIYGHDSGGVNSVPNTKVQVTPENYAEFYQKVVVQGQMSNGVGPMQLTWPGFFTDAASKGFSVWIPYDNFRYGFRLIKGYLSDYSSTSIAHAGTRYNGSSTYGNEVASYAATWQQRLAAVTPPPVSQTVRGPFPLAPGNHYGVDDHTNASHSGARPADKQAVMEIQAEVGATVDGSFGDKTKAKVVAWQTAHKAALSDHSVDGEVGPITWNLMARV